MPKQPLKTKHWCFTINNPTDDEIDLHDDRFNYIIIGEEVGEDGTNKLMVPQ